MASGRIALCLIDADNEFQQVAAQDAETAARRAGLDLETHWSGADLSAQLSLIRHLLDSPSPPSAILVMAVRDHGLARLAADAARAGIHAVEDPRESRKLIIETRYPDLRLVVIRAQDVPTFVEYGGADLGIAGKDVLMEHEGAGLYEPLDLGISRCRLVVAAAEGAAEPPRPRVATKYPRVTRQFYARRGVQPQIIKLYGSMELAPLVGLADRIVDLVDTGRTLAANGLVPLETVAEISARLVVNKASMKMQHVAVKALMDSLSRAVNEGTPVTRSACA